jgi:hypothetical protein
MRVKIFLGVVLLFMVNVAALYAQPTEPCEGTDPDTTCPLDTWVIVLAFIALIFTVIHLYRKRAAVTN